MSRQKFNRYIYIFNIIQGNKIINLLQLRKLIMEIEIPLGLGEIDRKTLLNICKTLELMQIIEIVQVKGVFDITQKEISKYLIIHRTKREAQEEIEAAKQAINLEFQLNKKRLAKRAGQGRFDDSDLSYESDLIVQEDEGENSRDQASANQRPKYNTRSRSSLGQGLNQPKPRRPAPHRPEQANENSASKLGPDGQRRTDEEEGPSGHEQIYQSDEESRNEEDLSQSWAGKNLGTGGSRQTKSRLAKVLHQKNVNLGIFAQWFGRFSRSFQNKLEQSAFKKIKEVVETGQLMSMVNSKAQVQDQSQQKFFNALSQLESEFNIGLGYTLHTPQTAAWNQGETGRQAEENGSNAPAKLTATTEELRMDIEKQSVAAQPDASEKTSDLPPPTAVGGGEQNKSQKFQDIITRLQLHMQKNPMSKLSKLKYLVSRSELKQILKAMVLSGQIKLYLKTQSRFTEISAESCNESLDKESYDMVYYEVKGNLHANLNP